MRLWTLALVLALVTATVPVASGATTHLSHQGDVNYWTQAFDVPQTTTLQSGTNVQLDLTYQGGTNETGVVILIEEIDGPLEVGVVVWKEGAHLNAYARSGPPVDVQISSQPVEKDTWTEISFTVFLVGIAAGSDGVSARGFSTLEEGRYRVVVSAPEATHMNVDAELLTDAPISPDPFSWTDGSAGELLSYRDWDAKRAVRTQGAEVLEEGKASVTVPIGRDLYGFFGPATSGATGARTCTPFISNTRVCLQNGIGGFGATWGRSVYHIEKGGWTTHTRDVTYPVCTQQTCPTGSEPIVFRGGHGTWTLHVDEHQAVGATPDVIGIVAGLDVAQ